MSVSTIIKVENLAIQENAKDILTALSLHLQKNGSGMTAIITKTGAFIWVDKNAIK